MKKTVFTFLMSITAVYASEFHLEDSPVLKILHQSKPLILEERVSFSDASDWKKNVKVIGSATLPGYRLVQNVRMDVPELTVRREAAESADGKCVEIGFIGDTPAYFKTSKGTLTYGLVLDFEQFKGAEFTAVYGRTNKRRELKGIIEENMPNGYIAKETDMSVLMAELKDGRKLVFDFNPEGVTSYTDFGPNGCQGIWKVVREGDKLVMFTGRSFAFCGGTVITRMRIYPGGKDEWMKRHARFKYGYYSDLPAERALTFTAGKAGSQFKKGQKLYKKGSSFGWVNALPEQISEGETGALYGAASGKAGKSYTYRLGGLYDGLGFLTFRFVSYDDATGPFSLKVGGKTVLENKTLAPRTVGDLTLPLRTPNGTLDMEFSGNFQIAAIIYQPLIRIQEDLKVFRGFWIAKGLYEPSVLDRSEYFATVPEFKAVFNEMPLPQEKINMNQVSKPLVREKAPCTGDPAKMTFRVQGVINSLGTGNSGSFAEFSDEKALQRRLDELQKDGTAAIIVNGFLSRHLYREHFPRIYPQMKKIVSECHKRGIKVIDHQDLTLLWNNGSAMRNIVSETDHLQHSLSNGGTNTGYCLNNPGFRKEFFDRFEKEIRNADLDGMMLDEVSFFDPDLCACRHCREKFTKDTGLVLPMNETLFNKKWRRTSLGRAWSAFRLKSCGDFFVEMRRRAEKVKKEFTLMVYTTHYGWASTYATMTQGCSLPEAVRGCDFAGTEIMSRNVIAARRPVMAYRKMKNSLKFEYGCPVFGLVYPGSDANIAFFGWALNCMNAQNTWFTRKFAGDSGFVSFAGGTDRLTQNTAGKVGIVFSTKSKDYAVDYSFTPEALGLSELLTDLRIDHRFLLDESLTEEKLKEFQVLILPGCSNLTDKECETIRNFEARGGKLWLTSHTGCCDAFGNYRKEWPFQSVFGNAPLLPVKTGQCKKLRIGDKILTPKDCPVVRAQKGTFGDKSMLWSMPAGKQDLPVVLKNSKGSVWCTARLGTVFSEGETTVGRKWVYDPDPALLKETKALLKSELGSYALIDAPELPSRVMTSCTQDRKNGKQRLALHLLNGTDTVLKQGEVVSPNSPADMWKPLEKDVWIRFRDFKAGKAVAESPDYPEKRTLQTKPDGKDTLVLLKKDDLKRFTVILLED